METATFLYLAKGFGGPLAHDPGVFAYGAEQVARGYLPYLGVFNQTGPLGQLVPGIGVWVGGQVGVGALLSTRITMMVVSVAAIGAAYLAGKALWSSRLAGAVSAFGLLSFEGFSRYATWGPREKTLMVLFVLLLMVALARRSWIGIGVTIALATLTWQPQFLYAMAGVLVLIAVFVPGWAPKAKALGLVVTGGAATTGLVLLPYLVTGHLRTFLGCFVIAPQHTPQPGPLNGRLGQVIGFVVQGFGASIWLVVAGVLTFLVASLLTLTRKRRGAPLNGSVVAGGVMLVLVLVWSLLDFQNWPDLFVFLPFAALGLGWMVSSWGLFQARYVPAVAILLVLGLTAVAGSFAFSSAGSQGLAMQRRIIHSVLNALPAQASVLSYFAPNLLAIADRPDLPGVQVQYWNETWKSYLNTMYPGGFSTYVHRIDAQAPDLIVWGKDSPPTHAFRILLSHYQLEGTADKDSFYVSRQLSPATRAAVGHAIARAR